MRMLILFCVIFLLEAYLYLQSDGGFAFSRFQTIGINTETLGLAERLRQLVFVTNYLVALSLLFLIPLSRRRWLRWGAGLLVAGAFVFELIYTHTVGRPPSFSDIFALNLAMITNVSDAATEHTAWLGTGLLWGAALFALPALTGLVARRKLSAAAKSWARRLALAGFAYLVFAYGFILYMRGEPANIGFPKGFNYLIATAYMLPATRTSPEIQRPQALADGAKFEKIIFVIDESIWAPALNSLRLPPARSFQRTKQTFSMGNCSAASNFYLRKAVKLGEHIYPAPSLFELAKSQKFETTYIDTQDVLADPTTRNYFDQHELSFVDHKVVLDKVAAFDRDDQAFAALAEILKKPSRDFVILNKYGAHFPYAANLKPADRSHDRLIDYQRAVDVHSRDFLLRLDALLSEKSVVFYTSDHGQYVPGPATHCNSGDVARVEEWQAPILVMTGNLPWISELKIARSQEMSSVITHAELAESVRESLGFGFAEAASLSSQKSAVPAESLCLYYGPPLGFFGKAPNCLSFDPAQ